MKAKQRHWLLSVYLLLSIITLLIMVFILQFHTAAFTVASLQKFPKTPKWIYPTLRFVYLVHIMSLIALFRWKKWGFFGAVVACIISVILNFIISGEIVGSLLGLTSIAVLYGVLQIGGKWKGWTQLD